MNVLFDHQIFTMQQFGGISRYFVELFERLNLYNIRFETSAHMHQNNYLRKGYKLQNDFLGKRRLINYINYYSLKKKVKKRPDLIHATYDSLTTLSIAKKYNIPLFITVHDLIYELFPNENKNFQKVIAKREKIYQECDKIIAISENTKADLINFYNIPLEKIKVIYHGTTKLPTHYGKNVFNGKFLLYVGQRGWYKNFSMLYRAFKTIAQQFPDLYLLCVGGGMFNQNEKTLFDSDGLSNRLVQISVNDSSLHNLYKNAEAFIFPSEYEGFGLPIIEAFSSECPTILSKASCFPEIAGDAALYFDLKNDLDLSEKLIQVLTDPILKRNLIKAGKERLHKYSWENTVQKTVSFYKSVYS